MPVNPGSPMDHYTSENPERIPFGPVDPEVGVIKIEDAQGRARAIVMNYACHADVVCQNYAISADFPGAATQKVEEAFGNNLHCLFVQGAGGNIESLIISSRRTGPDDPFQTDYSTIERVGGLLAYETVKLAKTLTPAASKETTIKYMNDSLKFTGRFDKNASFDVHISTILINDDIVIATFPGEPFIQLQLDWKKKVEMAHPFLFGYTWYQGTWPNYVPDIKSAALGGYGADQSNPKMIEVGSGEAVMNKHIENMYRLTGLMREEPGPVGFKPGASLARHPSAKGQVGPTSARAGGRSLSELCQLRIVTRTPGHDVSLLLQLGSYFFRVPPSSPLFLSPHQFTSLSAARTSRDRDRL